MLTNRESVTTRHPLLRADLAIKQAMSNVEQAQRQGERRRRNHIASIRIETFGSSSSEN
jgi:hypothetical protein